MPGRVWLPKAGAPEKVGTVYRDPRLLDSGSRRRCESTVRHRGGVDDADGIERVHLLRAGIGLPSREHFIVAGPAGAEPKVRRGFGPAWQRLENPQLALAA